MVSILTIALLLSSGHLTAAIPPSWPFRPLETFESQDARAAVFYPRWQQATLKDDPIDPGPPPPSPGPVLPGPRYSNSSFPGDETGDSPFFYCPESNPETDLFDISKIVLNPNPPHVGYPFVLHAHGYFREEIIGYDPDLPFRMRIRLKDESGGPTDRIDEVDFCKFIDLLEMDRKSTRCPPWKGNATIHKFEFVDLGIPEVSIVRYICEQQQFF